MGIQLTASSLPDIHFPAAQAHSRNTATTISRLETFSLMKLSNHLHSQLSSSWVIEQFYRESQRKLAYGGLIFQYPGEKNGLSFGILGGHNCSYDLVLNEEHLGTLDIYSSLPLGDSQLTRIERYLRVLLSPLRNALLYYSARQQAFSDQLTGAKNRAAFDADLNTEMESAQRHDYPLSLVVLDIDHFKQVNDNHGHGFGDEVLKTVSARTQEAMRGSDHFYRYGGEEFVIIAPHSGLDGTRLLAERIRIAIYDENHRGVSGLRLSASFGVAQLRAGESASALFERADQALYTAKHNGRNQVVA
jgi:diguanylate cyclase (GGDEF)-like protein